MLQLLNFEGNNGNNNQNSPTLVNNPNTSSQVNLSINQAAKIHNKYLSAIDFYKPNNEVISEANFKKEVNLPKVKIIDNKKKLNSSLDNIEEVNLYHGNSNNYHNNSEDVENSSLQPKVYIYICLFLKLL